MSQPTLHTEPMLPILTDEERDRAARWLMDNAPVQFDNGYESVGYTVAVRTLRNGGYR